MKIIKVSTSQGSLGKNKGCEKAPDTLAPDAESVEIVENNLEATNSNIEKAGGDFFIGGDHSITYPLFRAFARENKNPALLIFDAHADCVNDFHPPSHEDFNKVLIEEGTLAPENLMLVGLRKVDKIEQDYLDEKKIKHIYFKDIDETLTEQIKEFVKDKDLYLSIDIDVLNPEEASGTGYLPKGGMKLDNLLRILGELNPKRVDLVEINPDKDIDNKTLEAGKKIIGKII